MKQIVIGVISGLATATLLFASTSATASPDPIESWVTETNRKPDRSMVYPTTGESGLVIATFQLGQDGRPTAIAIRSASPAMARAARMTLSRMRNLPPLPAGYADKRIRLQMLVGNPANAADFYAQRKQLLAAAQTSNVQLAAQLQPVQVAAAQQR